MNWGIGFCGLLKHAFAPEKSQRMLGSIKPRQAPAFFKGLRRPQKPIPLLNYKFTLLSRKAIFYFEIIYVFLY